MKIDEIKNIEELLPKYIDGLLTLEENKMVEEWGKQSDENKRILRQMNAVILAVDTKMIKPKVDLEGALEKVKRRAHQQKRFVNWRWVERFAALLFIPLLAVIFIQYFYSSSDHQSLVRMIEVKTNPGMTTSFKLPDNTVVYLNSESSLKYPSTFTGDTRTVALSGEAFFNVTHDATKKFIVQTSHHASIEVHGTRFNVEAYDDQKNVSATLVEGKVGFCYADRQNQSSEVILCPGQRIVYDVQSKTTNLYQTSCDSEISWVDGKIIFANTALDDAVRLLEKRYNVEFVIKHLNMKEYAFTGVFTNQRLERILEYFKVSSGIKWKYVDDKSIATEKTKILLYK